MKTFKDMIEVLLQSKQDDVDAFFSCYREQLPKSIYIITKKIPQAHFHQIAKNIGWHLKENTFSSGNTNYEIRRSEDEKEGLGKHFLHTAGFFYIQETAAGLSAPLLEIPAGGIVLDMCAAPGGKTTQIANTLLLSKQPGCVVANEVTKSRIAPLIYNLNRTGMYNTCVSSIPGEQFGILLPETFDAILVDAPCSGEGTGFKSDAGTKRWRLSDIQQIAKLQKKLLKSAIVSCKVGGSIVYSTCTLNPWENEGVIKEVLDTFGDGIELEQVTLTGKSSGITLREGIEILSEANAQKIARFWPHIQHTGGFFIAKFTKKKHITLPEFQSKSLSKKPLSKLNISSSLQQTIRQKLQEDFCISIDTDLYAFAKTDNQIYIISPQFSELHNKIFTEKVGVPIYKISGEKLIPLHGLGNILGHLATKNTVQLNNDEIEKYAVGYDISYTTTDTNSDGYCILKREDYGISVGKYTSGTLKNKYIK